MSFDSIFSKFLIFGLVFILLFSIFLTYSPYSNDRLYMDFVNQMRFLKELIISNEVGFEREDILKKVSSFFNVVNLDDGCVTLTSPYNTLINVYLQDVLYVEVKTVSNEGFIPVKNIVDMDNFIDDGVPTTGLVKSVDGRYYSGCVILLKNR
ncbi:MAG: hypothetical protein RMJ36_02845 [Candidatus Calescibacterium sp.]|nr:hypothetical protein [Candidatus Calescibacterium sp.]MDW8132576.1 hypothetical protein [Candidatus Calescibacterium sp.]